MKYFGNWSNYSEMIEEWGQATKPPIPKDEDVLFASYGSKHYEGDALVVFTHDGKLYEAHGGHCSCYGLSECGWGRDSVQSQWNPEETSWDAIRARELPTEDQHDADAIKAFQDLVAEHT